MKQFFEYGGRGDREISDDSLFQLDSDAGGVFLITQKVGKVEFILAYCRSAIVGRWGCYCLGTFRRSSSLDLRRSWAVLMESELMIFHAVTVYLVPEEEWMRSELTIRRKRILARIWPDSKGHNLHWKDFLITKKTMITEEIALNAIAHYAGTGEIQDVLVPYFRQTGRWVGDCRNWTKSTYRLASSIMHGAVLPEWRRTAVNLQGEPILLTSFHWKKRRDVEIRWFEVRGSIRIRSLEAVSAPNLRTVAGYIYSCTDDKVGLPNLVSVGGDLDFQGTPNLHVPKLTSVGGSLMAIGCDLPCLETVGNRLWGYWRGSLNLPMLRSVGGSFEVEGAESLIAPALKWVCYDLNLSYITNVFSANKLVEVGGSLDARSARVIQAAALRDVGDSLHTEAAPDFYRPNFEDLVYWDMHPEAKFRWELREAVRRAMRSQQPLDI